METNADIENNIPINLFKIVLINERNVFEIANKVTEVATKHNCHVDIYNIQVKKLHIYIGLSYTLSIILFVLLFYKPS